MLSDELLSYFIRLTEIENKLKQTELFFFVYIYFDYLPNQN